MADTEKLYSPQVLALATSLARWPWDDGLPHKASARSRSCGSMIDLAADFDAAGRISRVAVRARACAIGQAAAAIFAEAAPGQSLPDIALSGAAIAAWLGGEGQMPGWPGLEAIAAAQAYPGRHGAILLAWTAAADLLSETQLPR